MEIDGLKIVEEEEMPEALRKDVEYFYHNL